MKVFKCIYLSLLICTGAIAQRVGVNTENPRATLDIRTFSTGSSSAEGFTIPKLTSEQLKGKDNLYGDDQKGALVYITTVIPSFQRTQKMRFINEEGVYYYDSDEQLWKLTKTRSLEDILPFQADKLVYDYDDSGDKTKGLSIGQLRFSAAGGGGRSRVHVEGLKLPLSASFSFSQIWAKEGYEYKNVFKDFTTDKNRQEIADGKFASIIVQGELNIVYMLVENPDHTTSFYRVNILKMATKDPKPTSYNNKYIFSAEKF